MVHEWEVLCITLQCIQRILSIAYAVNHQKKAIFGELTAKKMSNQAMQMHVCFHHLQNRLLNIDNLVIKNASKWSSSCQGCTERDAMCASCVERVYSRQILCWIHVLIAWVTNLMHLIGSSGHKYGF